MQIAQIVPKVRTSDEGIFDYAIPPSLLAMIKIGLLVEVPFHGRNVEGIIVALKRSSKISRLKEIAKIIDPAPVVDETHIKLAEWMSNYYLSPLGKTLFENIVPPAIRTIKNQVEKAFVSKPSSRRNVGKSKKYLVVADFSSRLKFYLRALEKTLARNQSTIILVPDLSLIPYFTKYIKEPTAILHTGLSKTRRWLLWDKIRRGEFKIILGSQSALFSPAENLGLIVIDQEENETYKSDQSPRFHAVDVANKLAEITGANLILGSLNPRITTYFESTQGKYQIFKKTPKSSHDITTVDMNSEKYVISNALETAIEETLAKKGKVLLVLNRKGEGTKFSCADCGWILLCQKCGLPLIPQKAENVCYRCEKSFSPPNACPKCQSVRLKPMGLGTSRLKKFLSDLFPKAKIIQVEKGSDKTELKNNWDIVITTSYGLKFNWPKIALVGVIDADQGLNFPDFSSSEKTFQVFYKFLRIGLKGIIQTHLPENYVIKTLSELSCEKFLLEELSEREKYNFPPFTRLLRLLYKNVDEKVLKEEMQKNYSALSKDKNLDISTPSPAFLSKERGKFRWQVLIKFKILSPESIRIFKSLPRGWIIDVDPESLL